MTVSSISIFDGFVASNVLTFIKLASHILEKSVFETLTYLATENYLDLPYVGEPKYEHMDEFFTSHLREFDDPEFEKSLNREHKKFLDLVEEETFCVSGCPMKLTDELHYILPPHDLLEDISDKKIIIVGKLVGEIEVPVSLGDIFTDPFDLKNRLFVRCTM
jgi:hypothetical protein